MQRREEILAKKAKLEELRRQRQEREQRAKEHGRRESVLGGQDGDVKAPTPTRYADRKDLDNLIDTLVGDRPNSRGPGTGSPASRRSRPSSTVGGVQVGSETYEQSSTAPSTNRQTTTVGTQTTFENDGEVPTQTVTVKEPPPKPETYNKFTQTTEEWSPVRRKGSAGASDMDSDGSPSRMRSPKSSKRMSRRQRAREEALRENLRREIEEELKAAKDPSSNSLQPSNQQNFPVRELTNEELNAVISSDDFLDFVDRSSKVIEKALQEEYDVLFDYSKDDIEADEDEDEGYASGRGKKGRRVRQVAQFFDEKTSGNRMVCDIGFSPKVRSINDL